MNNLNNKNQSKLEQKYVSAHQCQNLLHSQCSRKNCGCLCHKRAKKDYFVFVRNTQTGDIKTVKDVAFYNENLTVIDGCLGVIIKQSSFNEERVGEKIFTPNAESFNWELRQ